MDAPPFFMSCVDIAFAHVVVDDSRRPEDIAVREDGSEETRLMNAPTSPLSPFDSPACMAFDKRGGLLISNHAIFTKIPQHYLVLNVFVNDTELPLIKPYVP